MLTALQWILLAIGSLSLLALALIGFLFVTHGSPVRRVRAPGDLHGPPSPSDELFADSMSLHTRTALHPEVTTALYTCGDETYPRLWADLRAARETITLQMYYCQPGRMADTLLEVMSERARAGVRVLFLRDAFGSAKLTKKYLDSMSDAGVSVATFRPTRWYELHKAQQRSHIRVVVVDGRVGYTGGFGIDDKWYGDGRHENQWRDTAVRFTGPTVRQLQATFAAGWAEATGALLTGALFFPRETVSPALARLAGAHTPAYDVASDRESRRSLRTARVTAPDVGGDDDPEGTEAEDDQAQVEKPENHPFDGAVAARNRAGRAADVEADATIAPQTFDVVSAEHARRTPWTSVHPVACSGLMHASPTLGSTTAERFIALSIAGAKERLWITNSYFVPDDAFCALLTAAVKRDVDVRVLTAGSNSDVQTTLFAGRARYERLLAGGVRIFEYQPAMMHSKSLVVDGLWGAVGTMNFDNRSLVFNDETMLLVLDPGYGARLERIFERDLEVSVEMDLERWRRRPAAERLRERGASMFSRLL